VERDSHRRLQRHEPQRRLEAVNSRHVQIEHRNMHTGLLPHSHSVRAICDLEHGRNALGSAQQGGEQRPDTVVVVGHEHPNARRTSRGPDL
jgi:hypothetical protein